MELELAERVARRGPGPWETARRLLRAELLLPAARSPDPDSEADRGPDPDSDSEPEPPRLRATFLVAERWLSEAAAAARWELPLERLEADREVDAAPLLRARLPTAVASVDLCAVRERDAALTVLARLASERLRVRDYRGDSVLPLLGAERVRIDRLTLDRPDAPLPPNVSVGAVEGSLPPGGLRQVGVVRCSLQVFESRAPAPGVAYEVRLPDERGFWPARGRARAFYQDGVLWTPAGYLPKPPVEFLREVRYIVGWGAWYGVGHAKFTARDRALLMHLRAAVLTIERRGDRSRAPHTKVSAKVGRQHVVPGRVGPLTLSKFLDRPF